MEGTEPTGPVDVIVLTKNSDRILEKCLSSVYENVPVNRLIVVDGGSTDRTLKIVEEFARKHGNVILVNDKGTRATARMKGISLAKTSWFMFVDSDVVLCKKWFEKAKKYLDGNKKIGGVWGIERWNVIKDRRMLKIFLWLTRKIFEIRGGTHDILVRHDAIKDIKLPNNLHVFEDAYIKNWIEKKGYKIIGCYDPYCIHFRPSSVWTIKGSIKLVVEYLKSGYFKLILKLLPAYSFYTAYSIYRSLFNKIES